MVQYGQLRDLFPDAASRNQLLQSRNMRVARLDRFHREEIAFDNAVALARAEQKRQDNVRFNANSLVNAHGAKGEHDNIASHERTLAAATVPAPTNNGMISQGYSSTASAYGPSQNFVVTNYATILRGAGGSDTVGQAVNAVPASLGEKQNVSQQVPLAPLPDLPARTETVPTIVDVTTFPIGSTDATASPLVSSSDSPPNIIVQPGLEQPSQAASIAPSSSNAKNRSVVMVGGNPLRTTNGGSVGFGAGRLFPVSSSDSGSGLSSGPPPLGEFAPGGLAQPHSVSPTNALDSFPNNAPLDASSSVAAKVPQPLNFNADVSGSGSGDPIGAVADGSDARRVFADVLRRFGTDVDLLLSYNSADDYDARVVYGGVLATVDSRGHLPDGDAASKLSPKQVLTALLEPPIARQKALAASINYGASAPLGGVAPDGSLLANVNANASEDVLVSAALQADQAPAAVRENARERLAAVREQTAVANGASDIDPVSAEIDRTIAAHLQQNAHGSSRNIVFQSNGSGDQQQVNASSRFSVENDTNINTRADVSLSERQDLHFEARPLAGWSDRVIPDSVLPSAATPLASLGNQSLENSSAVAQLTQFNSAAPEFSDSRPSQYVAQQSIENSASVNGFNQESPSLSNSGVNSLALNSGANLSVSNAGQSNGASVPDYLPQPLVSVVFAQDAGSNGSGDSSLNDSSPVKQVSLAENLNLRQDMQAALQRYAEYGRRIVQG